MIKRISKYLLNSMKVAILGFCWFILFQIPWESLPNAPLGGKLIVAVVVWATWNFMVGKSTMPHEYRMPRAIRDKLHAVYEKQERGDKGEVAVLEAASELGYEVEDATETQSTTEPGSYSRNVKLVKREPGPWGEKVNVGWAHFNYPAKEYAHRRGEWFMYFL